MSRSPLFLHCSRTLLRGTLGSLYRSSNLSTRTTPIIDGKDGRGRAAVRSFIQSDNSRYGTPYKGGVGGDPFLTTEYVRTASVKYQQGENPLEEEKRRNIDPKSTSIVMFPGQGTQYVGMCGEVEKLPRYIRVLYDIASGILDYDLLDLVANGPQEELNKTVYAQPAILVSSLAALERLREEDALSNENCVATAGFSVGEIAALVFAGVISFEDSVRLVKVRAEGMQLASEITPSGMATVLFGADSKLDYALTVAKEWCRREYRIQDPICSIANYLFPHCKVVAGHAEAIDFLKENYRDFNIRKVKPLPVSGAFHTPLMAPAVEPFQVVLKTVSLHRPRMLVFSNVSGIRYRSSGEVMSLLPKQIVKPVMWEQCLHNIYKRPKEVEYPNSFECGPGSSLSSILKQVNRKASTSCKAISP